MSVVSSKKIIFCEGKKSSLDYGLLNRVLENMSDTLTIVPAGSKFTFSVFAQGYFFPDEVGSQQYIVFRDRDFDAQPTPSVQLLRLDRRLGYKSVDLTHRACVENYLIDAEFINTYWIEKYKEKQENPSSLWGHGDSPGVEAISAWIENSAKCIQSYQSVRWALSDLLRSDEANVKLKTTWTHRSGKLPPSLELKDCQTEALELIKQFRQATDSVTPDNFKSSLAEYQDRFNQTNFWTQKQYLIWFHGKDLQKVMQKQEPHYISLNHFFHWVIKYEQFDITRHQDIKELRKKIEHLQSDFGNI